MKVRSEILKQFAASVAFALKSILISIVTDLTIKLSASSNRCFLI